MYLTSAGNVVACVLFCVLDCVISCIGLTCDTCDTHACLLLWHPSLCVYVCVCVCEHAWSWRLNMADHPEGGQGQQWQALPALPNEAAYLEEARRHHGVFQRLGLCAPAVEFSEAQPALHQCRTDVLQLLGGSAFREQLSDVRIPAHSRNSERRIAPCSNTANDFPSQSLAGHVWILQANHRPAFHRSAFTVAFEFVANGHECFRDTLLEPYSCVQI